MDVWYLCEFVFAEVEFIETWQLKEATRDSNQFIVLQIKLHYLKREGREGREEGDGREGWREGGERCQSLNEQWVVSFESTIFTNSSVQINWIINSITHNVQMYITHLLQISSNFIWY